MHLLWRVVDIVDVGTGLVAAHVVVAGVRLVDRLLGLLSVTQMVLTGLYFAINGHNAADSLQDIIALASSVECSELSWRRVIDAVLEVAYFGTTGPFAWLELEVDFIELLHSLWCLTNVCSRWHGILCLLNWSGIILNGEFFTRHVLVQFFILVVSRVIVQHLLWVWIR